MALLMSPEYLMPPSASSGTPAPRVALRALGDGRDLRDARAGDYARGADRAGADAHLDAVDAERNQLASSFVGGHIAGNELHFGEILLHGAHCLHHTRRSGREPCR